MPQTAVKETLFPTKTVSSQDKLRGGYYTPPEICDFITKWVVSKVNSSVLEPSCGDGQFIQSLTRQFGNSVNITGVELFSEEAEKAALRGNEQTQIIAADAFEWFIKNKPDALFDAVVGNPPFIRYQNFPEEHRVRAFQIMQEEGLSPTRLTNAWLPFVVLATRALKPGGRLAMVLPAELLQVMYARELRKYLSTKFKSLSIVTFKKLVFTGILQETILLLGERQDTSAASISLIEFDDLIDLEHERYLTKEEEHQILDIDHDNEKWTQFYLSEHELRLIRRIEQSKSIVRFGDLAEVNVGVVTGNNAYFVINASNASKYGITNYSIPIVGRSNHVQGLIFNSKDYKQLIRSGERVRLFNPDKSFRNRKPIKMSNYIKMGQSMGVTEGYKCRIRLPHWWEVPSTWRPDAFLLRQIYEGPRIIANRTRATATDTLHRIRFKTKVSPEHVAAGALNSLTFALAEIRGRSYGGGVLELEPTEAENLILPKLDSYGRLPFSKLDELVREKRTEEALDIVDAIVFKDSDIRRKDIKILRGIWRKLKERRRVRNSNSK